MKRTITVLLLCTALCAAVFAQTENNFETEQNESGGVTITKYTGTIKDVIIPATIKGVKVTEIVYEVFSENKNITSVTIPDNVIGIGAAAFWHCTSLTSVTIGSGVTSIGHDDWISAFEGCTSLNAINVDVRNTAYSSQDGVLYNKDKTILYIYPSGKIGSTFIIPNSVTSIGESAFEDCTSLTRITIPNSITSIERWAFYNCRNLTSITIPDSVTRIGRLAFSGTEWYNNQPDGLVYAGKVAIDYKGTMPTSIILRDGTKGIADSAFANCKLASITIPQSVIYIGANAFWSNQLTGISIPSSVTEIGGGAFACNQLTNITIPNSINEIQEGVFADNWLTSITIHNKVTKIGEGAFYKNQLTNVNIPASVTEIGRGAFDDNPITTIFVDSGNTMYSGKGPLLLSRDGKTLLSYLGNAKSVTIPDGIINIRDRSFYRSVLTSVTITNSVTSIGEEAFSYCESLTSVTFATGSNITDANFGEKAFPEGSYGEGDNNLKSAYATRKAGTYTRSDVNSTTWTWQTALAQNIGDIKTDGKGTITGYSGKDMVVVIPSQIDGVTTIAIGNMAYYNSKLTSVTIPNSVTTIGIAAFALNKLTSVIIPNSVTTIESLAFRDNQLTSVTIPNSVKIIGSSAFNGNQLSSVTIPNSVTSIGRKAFQNNNLTSVTIGANVAVDTDNQFDLAYNSGGKRAGTYTRPNANSATWTRK